MKTVVKDWYIVSILDEKKQLAAKKLWGIVVSDETHRFEPEWYVYTSNIVRIENNFVYTKSGNTYKRIGFGKEIKTNYQAWLLMRYGFNPEDANLLIERRMNDRRCDW